MYVMTLSHRDRSHAGMVYPQERVITYIPNTHTFSKRKAPNCNGFFLARARLSG